MPAAFVIHLDGRDPESVTALRQLLARSPLKSEGAALRLASSESDSPPGFDRACFLRLLRTQRLGATLLSATTLGSTQALVAECARHPSLL